MSIYNIFYTISIYDWFEILVFFTNLEKFKHLLQSSKSCGVSGKVFGLITSIFIDRWLLVVLDGKSEQNLSTNACVP